MTLKWRERHPEEQPRDPLADFALNTMARFTAADLGLSLAEGPEKRDSEFDEQWWLAVVTVARNPENKSLSLSIRDLQEKAEGYSPGSLSRSLVIPGEYGEEFRQSRDLDVITIYARRDYLNAANAPDGEDRLGVSSVSVSVPVDRDTLNTSVSAFAPFQQKIEVSPQTVVTAVIDHGIAIAHDLFRREDGTGALKFSRVDFFFDMNGTPDAAATIPSTAGRIWTRAEIEGVVETHLHNGLLDEAAVYRDLGLIDWQTRSSNSCAHRVSHGTHVTGLAAGYPPADDTGTERRIIAVQLPTRLVASTMGQWVEQALEPALLFIAARLKHYRVNGNKNRTPLVMNFSFGSFMGPHDGTSEVERTIDKALSTLAKNSDRPRVMMLPSSNGHLSRCHGVIDLTQANPSEEVDWMLQPDDRSASLLSAWLPVMQPVPNGAVTLEVTVPGFATPHTVTVGNSPQFAVLTDEDAMGNTVAIGILHYLPPWPPTRRGYFGVYLVPTANPMNVGPTAPAGAWTLRFTKSSKIADLALNLWVQRDETLPGFPQYGRQSYLSDPRYQRFRDPGGGVETEDPAGPDSPVRRNGMINGIACGNLPVVIAGHVRSDGKMAAYSAGGPTENALRLAGPDASAVSDDSVALGGVLSAGSSSGARVGLNGTSVATPQVARWAANQIALAPTTPFDRDAVVAAAQAGDPASPSKPAETRTGGGRLHLGTVFGALRWPGQ